MGGCRCIQHWSVRVATVASGWLWHVCDVSGCTLTSPSVTPLPHVAPPHPIPYTLPSPHPPSPPRLPLRPLQNPSLPSNHASVPGPAVTGPTPAALGMPVSSQQHDAASFNFMLPGRIGAFAPPLNMAPIFPPAPPTAPGMKAPSAKPGDLGPPMFQIRECVCVCMCAYKHVCGACGAKAYEMTH